MYLKEILKEYLPSSIVEPLKVLSNDLRYAYMHLIPEEWYLRRRFKRELGYSLDLDTPRTFNEKLQWLKLHDRNPQYARMVDKYEAKKYVAELIGEEYIIPTLGVWNHFDEIDFEKLPEQFVLKCTHDSGSIAICKDKKTFDKKVARKKIEQGLRYNYFYAGGFEWPYKNVKPRIIAEKYMVDESRMELKDYKIHNFNGKPKFIEVDYDRFREHKQIFYSTDWEKLEYARSYAIEKGREIERPQALEEMLVLAKKLAKGHNYLRTDFYSIEEELYFGEMTFYPAAGFGPWYPQDIDEKLGECLNIQGGGRS